ncbi:hypothetical protein F2Q70_00037486 [Brassica cretica]|uniref:Uncharacterized protein n=1 Tax=Brassica cretica TaxID=69181 RepID=A0A8S9JUS8_BRACR|nr:hypothetical protein F2Q70_00037486 [Brassica cretica]
MRKDGGDTVRTEKVVERGGFSSFFGRRRGEKTEETAKRREDGGDGDSSERVADCFSSLRRKRENQKTR